MPTNSRWTSWWLCQKPWRLEDHSKHSWPSNASFSSAWAPSPMQLRQANTKTRGWPESVASTPRTSWHTSSSSCCRWYATCSTPGKSSEATRSKPWWYCPCSSSCCHFVKIWQLISLSFSRNSARSWPMVKSSWMYSLKITCERPSTSFSYGRTPNSEIIKSKASSGCPNLADTAWTAPSAMIWAWARPSRAWAWCSMSLAFDRMPQMVKSQ